MVRQEGSVPAPIRVKVRWENQGEVSLPTFEPGLFILSSFPLSSFPLSSFPLSSFPRRRESMWSCHENIAIGHGHVGSRFRGKDETRLTQSGK